jgi:hypothetical protein
MSSESPPATGGFAFAEDRRWLVRTTLSDPVIERVVGRLEPRDASLAEWVRVGLYAQCVSLGRLEPRQREQVRRVLVDVLCELLADDEQLRSLGELPPGFDGVEVVASRRRSLWQLLDLADAEATGHFAAGDPA